MKKLIIAAALVVANITPAYAISEGYRRQLEREHKTQVQDANGGKVRQMHLTVNFTYVLGVNTNCEILTVNNEEATLRGYSGKGACIFPIRARFSAQSCTAQLATIIMMRQIKS